MFGSDQNSFRAVHSLSGSDRQVGGMAVCVGLRLTDADLTDRTPPGKNRRLSNRPHVREYGL
jgi:hypothetical protein